MDIKELLKPKGAKETIGKYILRIDGKPKTSKTTMAVTASRFCPPPKEWDAAKPAVLSDMLWLQFEPGALEYPLTKGLQVPNVLDWSGFGITVQDIYPAIQALPDMAKEYRAAGVRTVVVDTLTSFNTLLLRDVVGAFPEGSMDRIRSYGRVDEIHNLLFDSLRAMELNIIGIVHLKHFAPFGIEGGKSDSAQKMAAQAQKQVDKVEASTVGGLSANFIPDMRPGPAGRWGRLATQVLVSQPRRVTVRAGVQEIEYGFEALPSDDFGAGGRWDLKGFQPGYLRPILESKYPNT